MGLFSKYPVILNYNVQGKKVDGMDITTRAIIELESRNDPSSYIEYVLQEGESPIVIADRVYDNPDAYWVILMFNNIVDYEQEWPLDQYSLDQYIDRKYEDRNGVHHYVSLATGAYVDEDHIQYDKLPITNWEYEEGVNDSKRPIKIPVPEALGQIIADYNSLIQL